MNRRLLLRALTGSSCVLPLTSLFARSALAQTQRPIRTLFIYHPNGCVPNYFHPKAGELNLPVMSAPLEKVKQHCIFMDGIGLDGDGNSHEGGAAKVLTGNHENNFLSLSSSIEVLMGKENYANGVTRSAPSLQMGVFASKWSDKSISFQGENRLPYQDNPTSLYTKLFDKLNEQSTLQAKKNMSAFNVAKSDLQRLQSQLGGLEKEKLEAHMEAFATLENKLSDLAAGVVKTECREMNFSHLDENDWRNSSPLGPMELVSDAQQDVAIQALSCDVTRAISFMYSHPVSPVQNPEGGMRDHDASHADAETHTKSKVWWMKQIAKFIQKMADTPDGDGSSLLDNTLVLLVSELGHGSLHDHWRVPFVLAGGKNTGLQTGRALDFRGVGSKQFGFGKEVGQGHANLLQLIAEKAGYRFKIPLANGVTPGVWS